MDWKHAADQPTVRALIDWYAATIAGLGRDPLATVPWAFGHFAYGTPVPTAARIVYRERVDLQRAFPDPFATDRGGFRRWWESQGRIEYPALFDDSRKTEGIRNLTDQLSPGFRAGQGSDSPAAGLRAALNRAIVDRSFRGQVAGRAWEVLKTEGVAGFLRRLSQ